MVEKEIDKYSGSCKKDIPKILVISNEDSNPNNLFSSVPGHCYSVDIVRSKDDAMHKLKSVKPDIILLDVSSKNIINKIKTCKKIKEEQKDKNINFIIFAEYEDNNIAPESLNLVDNNLIFKADDKSLAEKLNKIRRNYDTLSVMYKEVEKAKIEWERSIDCLDDLIILTDLDGNILRCNKKLTSLTGKDYAEFLGKNWQKVLDEYDFKEEFHQADHIEIVHRSGERFHYNSCSVKKESNIQMGNIRYFHNVTKLRSLREKIEEKNKELQKAYNKLKEAQSQIFQQEKMASIGQLAAGVAHEINNPIGFVTSNINTFKKYITKIEEFLKAQSKAIDDLSGQTKTDINAILKSLKQKQESLKINFILEDVENLIKESIEGTFRVKKIVQDLKSFSRVDQEGYKLSNIHEGLDSTINIVWNELKYKVTLKKEYGDIPKIQCNLGQLNQVFMNLLVNASQAVEEHGEITVKTWHENSYIYISISDSGCGISEGTIKRIFEPFFTTKDVGKGTGLGLSIAFDIIKKHNGEIEVNSEVGKGTTFIIRIPIKY